MNAIWIFKVMNMLRMSLNIGVSSRNSVISLSIMSEVVDKMIMVYLM